MRRRSFLALAASLALLPPARPGAAQTPVAVDGNPNLAALVRLLPDNALTEGGIRYADYAAQRAALGIVETGAEIDPDAWLAAMGPWLMKPAMMISAPLDPLWREGFGFDLRDVDQMVDAGPADASIAIFAGSFDAASLPGMWQAAGYAATETDGVPWYTLGEDTFITFDDPVHTMHLGSLSHLALLDDGTIAGTARRADMERVLALHGGGAETSLADGPAGALAAAPADLAVGWIVGGGKLMLALDPLASMPNNPNVPADVQERMATQAAEMAEEAPRMPTIAMALVGATAGAATQVTAEAFPGAQGGRSIAVVVPEFTADAAMVAETVTRRLTTEAILGVEQFMGVSYADAFPGMVVDVSPEGVVIVDLTPADDVPATLLTDLLQRGLLTILAWGG